MKAKILAVVIANLFAMAAWAQDDAIVVNGSISLGGITSDTSGGTKDEAKFQEYRDLKDGGIADVDVRMQGARKWADFFGENLGRRDQYIDLRGGYYGVWRGRVYLNDIVHNEGFNLITPFTGVGTNALRAPTSGTGANMTFNQSLATWLPFNLGIDRRHTGAMVEFKPAASPFYVNVEATEQQRQGIRIQAAAMGTSPGNGFVELPIPIDYTTRVVAGEVGYSSRMAHFALNVSKSKFTNSNETVTWTNPFFGGGIDTSTYSPTSDQTKWSLNGLIKSLPLDTQLAGRFTHAKLTDDVPLLTNVFNTANSSALLPTPANTTSFSGENVLTTASVALTSRPTRVIDTKLYYNYYKKENKSEDVIFTGQPVGACEPNATICEPERFNYTKKNAGVELWYRFAGHTKAIAGFDYVDLDRNRVDFDNTKDKKGYVELRSDAWETVAIRARYQRLQRRSHFLEGDAGVDANDTEFLNRFLRRFDAANVDQDLFKLAVDASVMPLLDLGGEFYVKNNKYKDVTLGRTKDDRQELYLSAAYGDAAVWRVNAFADAEYIRYDSTHRTINAGACTAATGANCFDPINGPSNINAYNWNGKLKERNYAFGVAGDWMFNPRLKFNAAYTYQKTEGSVDFNAPSFATLPSIPTVDDVKIHTFSLKGVYKATPAVDVTGGYAYEKYEFQDAAWDNYANIVAGGTPNQRSYLTGAYAFPQYTANVFYFLVTYRFH